MSRDEATHYTIGVFLPQNPFSHINSMAFSSVTLILFIQQLGSLTRQMELSFGYGGYYPFNQEIGPELGYGIDSMECNLLCRAMFKIAR